MVRFLSVYSSLGYTVVGVVAGVRIVGSGELLGCGSGDSLSVTRPNPNPRPKHRATALKSLILVSLHTSNYLCTLHIYLLYCGGFGFAFGGQTLYCGGFVFAFGELLVDGGERGFFLARR
jgi:hypothetical protein